jgi:hypothetical protein
MTGMDIPAIIAGFKKKTFRVCVGGDASSPFKRIKNPICFGTSLFLFQLLQLDVNPHLILAISNNPLTDFRL